MRSRRAEGAKGRAASLSLPLPPFPSSGESEQFEEEGYARGYQSVAGLDEVGRGPWAGPVVAAAVIFPRGIRDPEIKDSKLLTARKREELATRIKESAVAWGLGIVGPEEIDRINILNASLLAMSIAFKQLRPLPDYLLIDGNHKIPVEFFKDEGERMRAEATPPYQRAIKKGDQLSISIAAASIVAKVARDQMMMGFDKLYPEYGFARHKGYGCPAHLAALGHYGPAPIHRRSFRPVRERLANVGETVPVSLFAKG